jgi:hypothetical protein
MMNMANACKSLTRNLGEQRTHLGELDIEGREILKWI